MARVPNNRGGARTSWFAVITLCFDKTNLLHTVRHIVTIKKELLFHSSMEIAASEACATLVEIGKKMELSCPITVNYQLSGVPSSEQIFIEFDEESLCYGLVRGPEFRELNGQIAKISLMKLNNES